MIKKYGFPVFALLLFLAFLLFSPTAKTEKLEIYADMETHLLVPQRNVAVATVDLGGENLSLSDPGDFKDLINLEKSFAGMEGVNRVDSLFSTSVIKSEGDDILVSSLVPGNPSEISEDFIRNFTGEIGTYPELQPYVNASRDRILYYIYFSNNSLPGEINSSLAEVQKAYSRIIPFHYTGRAPILARTADLLTKDITIFLPLLILLITLVFLSFRNLRIILISWALILLSVGLSYFFIKFLGMEDSPLILLVPVFGMGLLSDYIIHYFYHYRFEPHQQGSGTIRSRLLFPLSLTAISTLTGFLSLLFLDGTGHRQLGTLVSISISVTFAGVFLWLPYQSFPTSDKALFPLFAGKQLRVFTFISRHRFILFLLLALLTVWGMLQLPKLRIEPYPIEQLPDSNTVKLADDLINSSFFGTVPYFIEVDTGENNSLLERESILTIDAIHSRLEQGESVGYAYSFLSVLKRMNFYFQGSEESLLTDPFLADIFPMLIEQYLLYYSSSVDPLEYESLLDSSYRYFSIRGMVYYRNIDNLNDFSLTMEEIRETLPTGWTMTVHGMVEDLEKEQSKLRNNWIVSFLIGSVLIFLTVLIFYRNLRLALLSLVPAIFSMIFSFGMISSASLSIDAFSIIFVAIITGLVIDYSIHTLTAIESLKEAVSLEEAYSFILNYSGIPILLSFLTSLFSFSVLLLSSFKGARNLGILLITSLIISFFLSVILLPLLALPHKSTNEVNTK